MKILNSIKWRLQIWYGLILVAVLVGFGVSAFQLQRGREFLRIDGELQRRLNGLGGVLRQPPRGRGPGGDQFGGPPEQFRPQRQPRPGDSPNEDEPDDFGQPPRMFRPPPELANQFDDT